MTRAALVILAAIIASPAMADHGAPCHPEYIPADKQQQPSVIYHVFQFDQPLMKNVCGAEHLPTASMLWGCASYQLESPETWHIYLDKSLNEEDAECVLLHEMAHLPPNRWKHGSGGTTFQDEAGNWRPRIGPIKRNHR